jgi:hypothetical protein
MAEHPSTQQADPLALPAWQTRRLAMLLDALGDPPVSLPELSSLALVAAAEPTTVDNLAAVIRRARGEAATACLWCNRTPAPHVVPGDRLCDTCHRDHRTKTGPDADQPPDAAEVCRRAERVLLARCCDHPDGPCECAEQVAADVAALAAAGLLGGGS